MSIIDRLIADLPDGMVVTDTAITDKNGRSTHQRVSRWRSCGR